MDDRKDLNINFGMSFFGHKLDFLAGILLACLVAGGIFVWIYLFSVEGEKTTRILWVELVVYIIMLVINIFLICRVGYDDHYLQNLKVTYAASIILSVVGLYIGQVNILEKPETGSVAIYYFLEFIVYALLSALMALIPAAIICLVMWCIMKMFGK